MKYIFIVIVLAVVVIMMSCKSRSTLEALPTDAWLVDVRTPTEFQSGSVPNAVNIPLSTIENSISQFENKGNIVLFCRSGNRSNQAQEILRSNGIENVYNGGSWKEVMSLIEAGN